MLETIRADINSLRRSWEFFTLLSGNKFCQVICMQNSSQPKARAPHADVSLSICAQYGMLSSSFQHMMICWRVRGLVNKANGRCDLTAEHWHISGEIWYLKKRKTAGRSSTKFLSLLWRGNLRPSHFYKSVPVSLSHSYTELHIIFLFIPVHAAAIH